MGYSASSHAVFGIKASIDDVTQFVQKRGCKHTISKDSKFCSECGKPAFNETKAEILDSMESNKLSYFYSCYDSKDEIIIGFQLAETKYNSYEPIEIPKPTLAMEIEILAFCKKYKLKFTDTDIKMYVLTYHSY